MPELTAEEFTNRLLALQSDVERDKTLRYFKTDAGDYAEHDVFVGVRMGQVFALAKEFRAMPIEQVELVLDNDIHELRAGALSIMNQRARLRPTTDDDRRALFDLYLRRHDRIDNWDLVDLAAPSVVGGYLHERDRQVLYELARSSVMWERRTAIMATLYFVRAGDLDDTMRLAEILRDDDHDLIHKPVGALLREVGKRDEARLFAFLDEHAAAMPRTMLRYAIERLDAVTRQHYRDA